MESLLARVNLVTEQTLAPDPLDPIVHALVEKTRWALRTQKSIFPPDNAWIFPPDDEVKALREEMFIKIKANILAKVAHCELFPWHGIKLTMLNVCEVYLIILEARNSLVWTEACIKFDKNWLSKADGEWRKYVQKQYKESQVSLEQCKAFVQLVWEALPGTMVVRRQGSRKKAAEHEATIVKQGTEISELKQTLTKFIAKQNEPHSSSSSSSSSEDEDAPATKVAKKAAPKAAPKASVAQAPKAPPLKMPIKVAIKPPPKKQGA